MGTQGYGVFRVSSDMSGLFRTWYPRSVFPQFHPIPDKWQECLFHRIQDDWESRPTVLDYVLSKTWENLRTYLFWAITQRVVGIPYRRFGIGKCASSSRRVPFSSTSRRRPDITHEGSSHRNARYDLNEVRILSERARYPVDYIIIVRYFSF